MGEECLLLRARVLWKNDNIPKENLEMHMPELEFGHLTEINRVFLARKLLMIDRKSVV